ncbi:helicase HerA-like domain-containing protein [Paraburkholderia phymatum]|uniref:Helicase HerA central domain-containing protein n=1 Tax=Paraburkholderia phymatum (strain DSM 17167 / CIP 108236 / LMG 21445 / STM815) TaxID=391038 RepID=B2JC75_PARP8|nr:helicase HerA-like domain-containing protein [Paraburkholderia phymatum]ACC69439.1 hypothetical protein Bphy_0246 [Paraburkholderia phymatum STM815]
MSELMVEISNQVSRQITDLLLAELDASTGRGEFGVVVHDASVFDRKYLLARLPDIFKGTKARLRVAVVGQHDDVATFKALNEKYATLVASDEESAVQWRNQNLKTIVVLTDEPLTKQGSLKDFSIMSEAKLIIRLCDQQRDHAEVLWLRTLWDALKSTRGPALSLQKIATFAAALQRLTPLERSVKAPRNLHALGLFPDTHLAEESSEGRIIRRLKANAELLNMVSNATPEDLDRMATYCRQLAAKEKVKFNAIRKRLRAIGERSSADLTDLEFSDVQQIWRGKVMSPTARLDTGSDGTVSPDKVPVESVVAQLLLDGGAEQLADLAERVEQLADQAQNDQINSDDEPLGSADVSDGTNATSFQAVTSVDANIIALSSSRSTNEDWGGVIDIESDRLDALTEITAFKAWQPFKCSQFKEWLGEFVSADLAPATCLDLFDLLAKNRAELLEYISELTVSPVAVLGGRPKALAAAEGYLQTYDQLLKQLQATYQEMYAQASDEAERLVHWLLAMELYVYRRDGITEVLLSPVHPLNLWRSVAIVKDLQSLGGKLSDTERATLIAASAEDVQLLNVLVLPQIDGVNSQASLLGHAGGVGHLPLFKEAPRGVLEPDGIKSVTAFATLIAQLRPFARPGLQVMFVNAPRPGRFLEAVLDVLDLDNTSAEDTFWGVHFRYRYTSDDTRGWTSEFENIDDQTKDRIRSGQERGLISVSVDPEIRTWPDVIEEARRLPAHLTVVFDPFEVRTALVARAGLHDLSPWMPSCEYRYNKLKKQIMVVPVAEEEIFATYFSAATLVHRELKQSTATHQPQVSSVRTWLDELADSSIWTIIADPHRVLVPRLGEAEVIDRRIEGARQITAFGRDLSPFVRRLDQQLRRTHYVADPETLEELVRDLVAMEPNGILGLVGGDKSKHIKGALGKLIAMRWYRGLDPSGLAVSLDTQNAQRWLTAGGHSNEKADLIGLREENGELIIDVIEVKTHDEGVPYSVQNGVVAGHAVNQVLSTLHALAEVFGGSNLSPLAKPRREVLREHLYTALLRDLNPQYIERWHSLLQDLFDGALTVRLSGRIVHVQLASIATTPSAVLQSKVGVPIEINTLAATEVGLVLTSTKVVAETALLERIDASTKVIPESIDPTQAYHLLSSTSAETTIENSLEGSTSIVVNDSREDGNGEPIRSTKNMARIQNVSPSDRAVHEVTKRQEAVSTGGPSGSLDIMLGKEVNSSQPVSWAPGRQSNGFFLVLGASGSGKTETLKVLGKGVSDHGVPVLVLDFHGDVQFPGLRSVLLSSGTSSTIGVNPMELDSQSAEETGLYDQRKVIRDMIRNAVPALGHRQGAILRDAIEAAYTTAGFSDTDPATWRNAPPTFADVEQILGGWAEDDARKSQRASIEGCLAAVQEIFEHPIFQRTEHVSVEEILAESVRLDLSKLTDEVRYIAAETLLRKIFRVLRLKGPIPVQPVDDRQRFRLFVVVDEAKILSTGGGDPDAPDRILNLLFTEARKFGLGMILASQMSDHFGSEVKANAATWLVLKPMDIREAKKNAPNVHMEPEALTSLKGKGDGYFRDRSSPRARRVQVEPLKSD